MAVARSLGWYVIKIHGGPYQLSGLPDVLAIKRGRAVWAEFKRPGGEPTRIQELRIRELEAAGCRCAVVRSATEYCGFLVKAELGA